MKSSWFIKLKDHLLLWFVVQLIVSIFISHEVLTNYSSWEENPALINLFDNSSVYSVALLSLIFTVLSSCFVNLTVVLLLIWLVYALHKRWTAIPFNANHFSLGAQFIIYALIISEIGKYFCVLLWSFNFSEWEELRLIINVLCICIGGVLAAYVWLKERNLSGKTSISSILITATSISGGLITVVLL